MDLKLLSAKVTAILSRGDELIAYPEHGNPKAKSQKSYTTPISYPTMHHLV